MRRTSLVIRASLLLPLLALVSPPICAQGFRVVCTNAGILPFELTQDANGAFYGTTRGGGAFSAGTVFKMDPAGCTITTLHSFAGGPADGKFPHGGVLIATDGKLYGTTYNGGADDRGTVFRMDTDGGNYTVTSLPSPGGLCGLTGDAPTGSPFQASDDVIYVAMEVCGPLGANGSSSGTVATVTAAGPPAVTGTAYFDHLGPMTDVRHRVVEGTDGLYGVAFESFDSAHQNGAIYKVPLGGGDPQAVHIFVGEDGDGPDAPLWRASDDSLWGTTNNRLDSNGGILGPGTLFRLNGSTLSTVHEFTFAEGPAGENMGVGQGADGMMYGMTVGQQGSGLDGILFRTDLAGNFHRLARVVDLEIGRAPYRPFYAAQDGKLWGQCPFDFGGGANGVYYTIDTTQWIDSITPSSGPAAAGTAVSVAGAGFVAGAELKLGGEDATGESVPDPQHVNATTPSTLAPGALYLVKVVLPDGTRIVLENGWMADFLDVPGSDIFHVYVETVLRNGITAGCGGGNYCRNDPVKRKQMAVFLLKAKYGADHVPPPATGTVFADVPISNPFAPWIEELASLNITGGCGGGNYCPEDPVRRDQMAVFLLKAFEGSGYTPPDCTGVFADVACPGGFAVNFIEELYNRAVTGGCIVNPLQYCPLSPVLRGQMAVFISKKFALL